MTAPEDHFPPEDCASVSERKRLPAESKVVRLYRIIGGDTLIACEAIEFLEGEPAIDMTFRRAAISGRVEIGGEIKDHFADVLDAGGDSLLETVALDAASYAALKYKWMRCKLDAEMNESNCASPLTYGPAERRT
jgi:hypothetical protein